MTEQNILQDAKYAFQKLHASSLVWLTGSHFAQADNEEEAM